MIHKFNVEFSPLLYIHCTSPALTVSSRVAFWKKTVWLRELILNFSPEIQMICFQKRGASWVARGAWVWGDTPQIRWNSPIKNIFRKEWYHPIKKSVLSALSALSTIFSALSAYLTIFDKKYSISLSLSRFLSLSPFHRRNLWANLFSIVAFLSQSPSYCRSLWAILD